MKRAEVLCLQRQRKNIYSMINDGQNVFLCTMAVEAEFMFDKFITSNMKRPGIIEFCHKAQLDHGIAFEC